MGLIEGNYKELYEIKKRDIDFYYTLCAKLDDAKNRRYYSCMSLEELYRHRPVAEVDTRGLSIHELLHENTEDDMIYYKNINICNMIVYHLLKKTKYCQDRIDDMIVYDLI